MTKQTGSAEVIVAMIERLPPVGSVWPMAERVLWLQAMESVLHMVYGPVEHIDIGPMLQWPVEGSSRRFEPVNSAEPTDEAMARDVVAASGSREDAAETTEAPAKPWVGSERSSSAETDRADEPAKGSAGVSLVYDTKTGAGGTGAGGNGLTPGEQARQRRAKDDALHARPPGCPGNLELAKRAIAALGPASAVQIRNWVAKNYWSMVPDTWPGCLYNFVSAGKLGRQGINFIVVEPRASEPAPVQPKPAPKPAPPAPPAPSKPAAAGIKFEHNGRHTMLGDTHAYAIANRLRAAMGKGHIPEEVLADKTFGSNTQTTRDRARMACTAMNDRLAEVGLKIERYPDYGYVMKEV